MTLVALLRHGDTAWSAAGRIQGRRDVPLSDAGRTALGRFRLPARCREMRVVTSPLQRCTETAALLGAADAPRDARLVEMSWGAWEGSLLAELRAELGEAMRANEARGWDFRPADGESPREVLARVQGWLRECDRATLAVTHRGVIRAVFAAATGWDLCGAPPAKLDWHAVHLFRLAANGAPSVEALNVR
ncbi:MAG TPA: histidine phosphatase family protein [Burkholderiales bacterium]|jgi:broad specificity phosphatase PhoE|nr:histidine phosphatase family protein [Burkholderiales bacterium]